MNNRIQCEMEEVNEVNSQDSEEMTSSASEQGIQLREILADLNYTED